MAVSEWRIFLTSQFLRFLNLWNKVYWCCKLNTVKAPKVSIQFKVKYRLKLGRFHCDEVHGREENRKKRNWWCKHNFRLKYFRLEAEVDYHCYNRDLIDLKNYFDKQNWTIFMVICRQKMLVKRIIVWRVAVKLLCFSWGSTCLLLLVLNSDLLCHRKWIYW